MLTAYIDTGLLVKRYVTEPGSDELDAHLFDTQPALFISELTRLELASSFARKQSEGRIIKTHRADLHQQADEDVLSGLLKLVSLDSGVIRQGLFLMQSLEQALTTLDAIHLASALKQKVDIFMTDDNQLARAAAEAGLQVWSTQKQLLEKSSCF